MRAARLTDFGIENVRLVELADPVPTAGEVLIATEAAAINPVDASVVSGAMKGNLPDTFAAPYTLGWDIAGTVIAVGPSADTSMIGARVVGLSMWIRTGQGTQASLVTLPASDVAIAPDGLPSAQLTTIGLNGLTAWRAIDELNPTANETIVITGAAGSVGGFALELALERGARVIAAVSESDRETIRSLGVAEIVTREQGDLAAAVREIVPDGVDALLDTASIGAPTLGAIRDGGRFVTVTVEPQSERDITVTKIYGVPDSAALSRLIEMRTAGRLHTPVAREFDVSDARAAYEEFASGPHHGRIVLTFDRDPVPAA